MIGSLSGRLLLRQPPLLLIEVGGIGYEVEAPMSTFYALPEDARDARLYIHQSIREDAHTLYGFASLPERALFRELLRITGVGPKLALGVLSGMGVADFWSAVRTGEWTRLVKLPGVGKKTAERMLIDLRDRIPKDLPEAETVPGSASAARAGLPAGTGDAAIEAQSALITLGYKPADAQAHVLAARATLPGAGVEGLIREALKRAVRR